MGTSIFSPCPCLGPISAAAARLAPAVCFRSPGPRGPGHTPRPLARPGLGADTRAGVGGWLGKLGHPFSPRGKWGHPFSPRVLVSAPFPPPLRGSPRPSVSGHPGLAARATCRGRWRGRASAPTHERVLADGWANGDIHFLPVVNGDIHFLPVSLSRPLFRRRCAARPGRLFPVTRASRPGLHAAAAGAAVHRYHHLEDNPHRDTMSALCSLPSMILEAPGRFRRDPGNRSMHSAHTRGAWKSMSM